MSKKRKKPQPDTDNPFLAILSAMAQAAPEMMPTPSAVETVERIRRSPNVARVWLAQMEKPCCDKQARDGLALIVPTVNEEEKHRREIAGQDPTARIVQVQSFDEHTGATMGLVLDTEALKSHVNNCIEAIKYMEARDLTEKSR